MIVYDCEIINAIPDKSGYKAPGIEYCAGWRDFKNMGISVIGVYDYDEQRYRIFCEDNMDVFQTLVERTDCVIGFNSLAFDNELCRANDINIPVEKSYDLLVEVWKAAGLSPSFRYPSHIGYGLDAVAAVNLGARKSGNGALAPIQWQRGQTGAVIDYCLQDVRLTVALIDLVRESGSLLNPKGTAHRLSITKPGRPHD